MSNQWLYPSSPTRCLAMSSAMPPQVSMTAYQLLGGSRSNPVLLPEHVASPYTPGSRINMFSYKGPRRAKARRESINGCSCKGDRERASTCQVQARRSYTAPGRPQARGTGRLLGAWGG